MTDRRQKRSLVSSSTAITLVAKEIQGHPPYHECIPADNEPQHDGGTRSDRTGALLMVFGLTRESWMEIGWVSG